MSYPKRKTDCDATWVIHFFTTIEKCYSEIIVADFNRKHPVII